MVDLPTTASGKRASVHRIIRCATIASVYACTALCILQTTGLSRYCIHNARLDRGSKSEKSLRFSRYCTYCFGHPFTSIKHHTVRPQRYRPFDKRELRPSGQGSSKGKPLHSPSDHVSVPCTSLTKHHWLRRLVPRFGDKDAERHSRCTPFSWECLALSRLVSHRNESSTRWVVQPVQSKYCTRCAHVQYARPLPSRRRSERAADIARTSR